MKITATLAGPCFARTSDWWRELVDHTWTISGEFSADTGEWKATDVNVDCHDCGKRFPLTEADPGYVAVTDVLADKAERIERLWSDWRRLKATNQPDQAQAVMTTIKTLEAA